MKYNVGDLLLVKHYEYKLRSCLHPRLRLLLHPRLRLLLHPLLHLHLRLRPELFNSYGIVTQTIKHSDVWEGESTNGDNTYVWFSQLDGKEYYFCEDEVTGEII